MDALSRCSSRTELPCKWGQQGPSLIALRVAACPHESRPFTRRSGGRASLCWRRAACRWGVRHLEAGSPCRRHCRGGQEAPAAGAIAMRAYKHARTPPKVASLAIISLPRSGFSSLLPRPETLLRWHRDLVRRRWAAFPDTCRDPKRRECVLTLARENPRWGYRRIRGQGLKLGFRISHRGWPRSCAATASRLLRGAARPPGASPSLRNFGLAQWPSAHRSDQQPKTAGRSPTVPAGPRSDSWSTTASTTRHALVSLGRFNKSGRASCARRTYSVAAKGGAPALVIKESMGHARLDTNRLILRQ